jgi:NHL repeat
VRRIDADGVITTVAGTGAKGFGGDGDHATTAELNATAGLAIDRAGNLYIADQGNNRVRRIDTNGVITTVAGGA